MTKTTLMKAYHPHYGFILLCTLLRHVFSNVYQEEICSFDDDRNPEHFCHNNATCIDTEKYMGEISNEPFIHETFPEHMCNCSAATKAHPGQHFTGSYCEYSDLQVCNKGDRHADSLIYCHSQHGSCIQKEDEESGLVLWICDCAAGYTGTHCGHHNESIPVESQQSKTKHESCQTTTCQNGGQCVSGLKDISHTILGELIKQHDENDLSHIMKRDPTSTEFEHCQCPSGYTGYNCQHKFKACPNGKHVCFHGSECVGDDEDTKCSCNQEDNSALAGKYCQHQATIQCGDDKFRYCFNGASCDGLNCRCADGWRGPSCQYSEKVVLENDDLVTESRLTENHLETLTPNLIFVAGVIGFLGITTIIIAVAMKGRRRDFRKVASLSSAGATAAAADDDDDDDVSNKSLDKKANDDVGIEII